MSAGEHARLLGPLAKLAVAAGHRILATAPSDLLPRSKVDLSPVTAADEAAEEVLREGLMRILPGIPVIAEEGVSAGDLPEPGDEFFLVDPLDGTREFLAGCGEYAVNVALVSNGIPKVGVIYAPALGILYAGSEGNALRAAIAPGGDFDQAQATPIRARPRPQRLVAAVSRSHPDSETEQFLETLSIERRLVIGSALKFAAIAEGLADIYPRLVSLSEWDVAAGHALVTAAGGSVQGPDGRVLSYGGRSGNFRLGGFIAWGAAPA